MGIVALMHAEAGSAPSGTGSFNYFTHFTILVANLGFEKVVGIWGHNRLADTWSLFPASFSGSVAGNQEIWRADVFAVEIDRFSVRYDVGGSSTWDNNGGHDWFLSTDAAHTDGTGTVALNPNVQAVSWGNDGAGNLVVTLLVRNIDFAKSVGIVYTTDNWATTHVALGGFQRNFPPATTPFQVEAEEWTVKAPVGAGTHGQFAAFYGTGGSNFWDNNFGINYNF